MKKIFLTIVFLTFATMAFAQDAPVSVPKQKTLEEFQWQGQALQNEFMYLQERLKNVQAEFKRIQDEIKAMQPAPQPKPAAPKTPKDHEDKGKK